MSEQNKEKIIYKHPIPHGLGYDFDLFMAKDAQFLSVQLQDNQAVFWVMENTLETPVKRRFVVLPTGRPFDCQDIKNYIGTVQFPDHLVGHLFEVVTAPKPMSNFYGGL